MHINVVHFRTSMVSKAVYFSPKCILAPHWISSFTTSTTTVTQLDFMWHSTMSETVESSAETHGSTVLRAKMASSTSWAEAVIYNLIITWSSKTPFKITNLLPIAGKTGWTSV